MENKPLTKDYGFKVAIVVDAGPNTNFPVMEEMWRARLKQLAGERLLKQMENATMPFSVATKHYRQVTENSKEMIMVLEVQVKFPK